MKEVKIKLRSVDSVHYETEHTQEVRYTYSIEDSIGLLEIYLTVPEEAEPVEQFVIHMKDLYKGFSIYNMYYKNYKYILSVNGGFVLTKIKMY